MKLMQRLFPHTATVPNRRRKFRIKAYRAQGSTARWQLLSPRGEPVAAAETINELYQVLT